MKHCAEQAPLAPIPTLPRKGKEPDKDIDMTAALNQSYGQGATDVPLIEQTIGDFFDDMVAKHPDREALISRHEGKRFTYRELQAESGKLASALLNLGLEPGDRVGIWSHNNAPWVLMQIATAKAGLVLVNINPAYRTSELEYALNKVGCKVLVTMAQFKTSDYLGICLLYTSDAADE